MTHEPFAAHLAVELARRHAGSALPDAPVVPEPAPRTSRVVGARTRMAVSLRTLAGWVEPSACPSRAGQPG